MRPSSNPNHIHQPTEASSVENAETTPEGQASQEFKLSDEDLAKQ